MSKISEKSSPKPNIIRRCGLPLRRQRRPGLPPPSAPPFHGCFSPSSPVRPPPFSRLFITIHRITSPSVPLSLFSLRIPQRMVSKDGGREGCLRGVRCGARPIFGRPVFYLSGFMPSGRIDPCCGVSMHPEYIDLLDRQPGKIPADHFRMFISVIFCVFVPFRQ